MDKELEKIVQRMMDAGESEEAIAEVVRTYDTLAPEPKPEPVKKKEILDSPVSSEEGGSVLVGSEVEQQEDDTLQSTGTKPSITTGFNTRAPILEIPEQIVDEPVAQVYDSFKKEGLIKPAQQQAIQDKIKAQEKGDRGFLETAIAMTEGFLKTGVAIPVFQYDTEEDLVSSRELKNQIDFLSNLPKETVAELKVHAGEKIADLEASNMNTLAENKMMEERGKQLVNELKRHNTILEQFETEGQPIPEEAAAQYRELHSELEGLTSAYNKNVDSIENNNKDVGNFYEEINLLKKNYGGLDYYKDMSRLTAASMIAGAGELAISTQELVRDKTGGALPLVDLPIDKADVQGFREEIVAQQEELKPAMSVTDINGIEDFGAWIAEQAATQLPVITTLVATGGTVGLGALGVSAAGQKIGELEDRRAEAVQSISELEAVLDSNTEFSEEELKDIDIAILEAKKLSGISDDEMYMAGLGTGVLEILTERVTLGILSKGKRAYLAAKKAGGNSLKEFSKGVGRNSIAGLEEGGAEFINAFGSNLIDVMYLNDSNVHIFDNTLDALASGTALGFGMRAAPAGVGMGAKAFMAKAKTAEIKAKTQKISDIVGELEDNSEILDSDTKQLLKNKVTKLKKEVSKEIKTTFDGVSRMYTEDIKALIDLDKDANKITQRVQRLQKSNLSKERKAEFISDLKTDLDKIVEKKQELLDKKDGPKPESAEVEGIIEGGEGATEVQGEAVEGTSKSTDVERPSIEQTVRTFRVVNPFKQGKPLISIPLSQTLDKTIDVVTQKIVDRFFPIKKIQGAIESKVGKKLPKEQNFRQAEIAMHGKAAAKMETFSNVTETLIKDTVNSDLIPEKGKTSVDRLSDYLMARHAQERNAHVRKLPLKDEGQEINEAGSGMTDKESQAILDSFKDEELVAVEKLAERVDTILEETRQIMVEGGLITDLQKDVLTNYYDNYVPLQGFESDDLDSDMASAFGLSLSVKGKESKRASGRITKADNVIANIVGFRNNMIVRAEKNAVMQALHSMVEANPDPEVWETFSKKRPDLKWGLTTGGKAGFVSQLMSNTDKYVGVKIKGEQHYIKFGNERLAQVINAASVEKTDIMTKTMGKFNRYLSTVLTTYNPEFMLSNFLRDIQAAIINQASERDISHNSLQGKSFIKKTIAATLPAIKTIYKVERGKTSDAELDRYYKEFKEDGAKTDWFYAKNVEGIKKDIQKMIKAESKGKNPISSSIGAVKAIGRWLDDGNTAIENGVRLASYMEARKAGVTRADAAEFAKELTINFNQKGELGTMANTMYLFFNASVQGTVRFGKAMTTFKKTVEDDGNVKFGMNRAQKIAAAMTAASAMNTMLNILLSDEDEDGVSFYNKIPDYEKERNLIIMNRWSDEGDYFKIPLPYGYNIFHNLGTVATEVSMGTRSAGDGVGFMINSLLGAFNPLSVPESDRLWVKTLKTISPTILKPGLEIMTNESHFGSSIYNENFQTGVPKPESELGRASTNEYVIAATKFINEATGGSEFVTGRVDIHPDKVEHMFEFIGGGSLKFINNVQKTGSYIFSTMEGEEVEIQAREIPFLRKLYGEKSEFIGKEIYYDRKTEIDQLYAEYKNDLKNNKGKERYKGIATLKRKQKAADKRLKAVRKEIKKINKIEDNILKSKKLKEARDKESKIINGFNKSYNELRD